MKLRSSLRKRTNRTSEEGNTNNHTSRLNHGTINRHQRLNSRSTKNRATKCRSIPSSSRIISSISPSQTKPNHISNRAQTTASATATTSSDTGIETSATSKKSNIHVHISGEGNKTRNQSILLSDTQHDTNSI